MVCSAPAITKGFLIRGFFPERELAKLKDSLKMGQPRPLFRLFSVFSKKQ